MTVQRWPSLPAGGAACFHEEGVVPAVSDWREQEAVSGDDGSVGELAMLREQQAEGWIDARSLTNLNLNPEHSSGRRRALSDRPAASTTWETTRRTNLLSSQQYFSTTSQAGFSLSDCPRVRGIGNRGAWSRYGQSVIAAIRTTLAENNPHRRCTRHFLHDLNGQKITLDT